MNDNPFKFDSPVYNQQSFFGRETIIHSLMNRLRSTSDSSIIGERLMGRTSLLFHLQDPDVLREYGLDPEQYLFVYFNFDRAGQLTPTLFWQRLLGSLAEKITDDALRTSVADLRSMDVLDPFDIEDLFLDISNQGIHVTFLLDEFEAVTQATKLDADFFSHLRSLATGQYVGLIFVTSSRQKLSELSHAGIVGSPFFNIFETFFLKPFQPVTAKRIITASLADADTGFDPLELTYLMELSGRHPFFLQMAASYLFDAYAVPGLAGEKLRPARLERVEREFLIQTKPHFAHYWGQSTDRQKIFLAALSSLSQGGRGEEVIDAEKMKQSYQDAEVEAQVLKDRGLISHGAEGYHIFSPAYERWIVQEITQTDSNDNFVTWLEQNEPYYAGSLQTLHDRAQDITTLINPKYWNLLTEWLSKSQIPELMLDRVEQATEFVADSPLYLAFVEE